MRDFTIVLSGTEVSNLVKLKMSPPKMRITQNDLPSIAFFKVEKSELNLIFKKKRDRMMPASILLLLHCLKFFVFVKIFF